MADTPDYSLTVYSAAQPGQLSTANLTNYGLNLPGYALVRDSRRMTLPSGTGDVRFTEDRRQGKDRRAGVDVWKQNS